MSFFSLTTILFTIVFIVFGSFIVTAFTGAPWVPTGKRTVKSMLEIANVGVGDIVFDLGSGDGRIIFAAARRGAKAIGIDINPFWILWCRMVSILYGYRGKVEFLHGNFYDLDLSEASVVTMYLLQENKKTTTVSVAQIEVESDHNDITDYIKHWGDENLPFDYVWFTASAERPTGKDFCASLKKRFKGKQDET